MKQIAFINLIPLRFKLLESTLETNFNVKHFNSAIAFIEYHASNPSTFDLLIFYADVNEKNSLLAIQKTMPYFIRLGCPVVLLSDHFTFNDKKNGCSRRYF